MSDNMNPDDAPTRRGGSEAMLRVWENGGDVDMSSPADPDADRARRDATRFISVRDLMRMDETRGGC